MKRLIASIIALIAINASAYDVTNTVTIVSNIYNRISEEHWITNNIKNTHTNYHYTNNVYTVSNVTLLVSQQTFKTNTTVNLDVSQQAIAEARAQANRAERIATNALDFANAAANSATTAQSHAADAMDYRDEAEYYMEQAHGQVQPIIDEGDRQIRLIGNFGGTMIANIQNEKVWFEQHFGQMVTNVNIYHNEDQVARAGVAQNASDISALGTRMGAAEGNISSLQGNVSGLNTRMGTAEGNISSTRTTLENLANQHTNEFNSLSGRITQANDYTTAVSNKLEIEIQNVATSKVEDVEERLEEIEALSFKSYPDPINGGEYKFLIHNQRTPEYVFYLTIDTKNDGEYRSNAFYLGSGVVYFDQDTKYPNRAHQPANHCKIETVSGTMPDVIRITHYIGRSTIEPHVSDRLTIATGNYEGTMLKEYLIDSLDTSSNRMILPTNIRPSNCYLEVFISANRTSRFDLIDEEFASLSNWVERVFQKK